MGPLKHCNQADPPEGLAVAAAERGGKKNVEEQDLRVGPKNLFPNQDGET